MTKFVIVVGTGSREKLQTAALIAAGGVANDIEIVMFFMHEAAYALHKDNPVANITEESVFPEVTKKLTSAIEEGKVPYWLDLLEDLREVGDLRIIVCAQAADLVNLTKDPLNPIVDDIGGVAVLAEEMVGADQVLFV